MQRLSVISLVALVAVGGILAFAVFVHPALPSFSGPSQPGLHTTGSNGTGSNSTLLTQPPASSASGDDDGSNDG